MKLLLKALYPLLWRFRWRLLAGIIFLILSNFFSIYPARLVQQTLDETLMQIQRGESYAVILRSLGYFVVAVIILAIARGFFLFLVRQTIITTSRHIETLQRQQLFQRYLSYSFAQLKRVSTGDLMARLIEDTANVRMFTGPGIMYTLNTFILFVMVLVMMLQVNVKMTFYVLAPLPLLAFILYKVQGRINRYSTIIQRQLSDLTGFTEESLTAIRLIKALVKERVFFERFHEASLSLYDKSLRLIRFDALFYPSIALLIGLSTLFTVWLGGLEVLQGRFTYGNIAEFVIYVNLLTWPIASLGWITSMIQQAAASQARIEEFMRWRSELSFPKQKVKPKDFSLVFQQVWFRYPNAERFALKDVDFILEEGKVLGVTGRTGSGKSTLAYLCARLYDPTQGTVLLGRIPLQRYPQQQLYHFISYAPQEPLLFPDTIRNNVRYAKLDATEEEIVEALRFADLWKDIEQMPQGIDTFIGERGVMLSGGQQQRLALARAWLKKAPVLILDDVLSAVDTETEQRILYQLRHSSYRPTLIVISHRLSALQQADYIIVLEDGKIIEQGSHEALLRRKGFYYCLYHLQFRNQPCAEDYF